MGTESVAITFKPLKQGRFRVITRESDGRKKFGPIINQGQTKRWRGAFESQLLHRLHPQQSPPPRETIRRQEPKPTSNLPRELIDGAGDVRCPFCRRWNFRVSAGERTCSDCRGRFIAVAAEQASNLLRARIDTSDNSAMCPHCGRWNFGASPGEQICSRCNERFMAIR